MNCPCGSNLSYEDCCQPYHLKLKHAATAEKLMRSRYAAFARAEADYLYETTHPSRRKANSKAAYLKSANSVNWVKLEIVSATENQVEFRAFYLNGKFETGILHEKSNFKFEDGRWYYVDGVFYA